jgi:cell fate regulator YaaT (PSP1 superfamily)
MEYQLYNGECCLNSKGCCLRHANKLTCYDYLSDIAEAEQASDYIEVQFKNTRKEYYLNSDRILLIKGDVVVVEAASGFDVGTVTMTGKLVLLQMAKARMRSKVEVRHVCRKALSTDLKKYKEFKAKEHETMIYSRKIAERLGLQMKISDVEYQGDGGKAIFYYIADDRIDFRQLIKDLAEIFRVRIEMKQIGARQEAGRVGGIGTCGRELCCSGWVTKFISVSTGAARLQDVSLNPQKLAGQCAKLKCCLNYETDAYAEAWRNFPTHEIQLETQDNVYYHFKTEVFKNEITYSTDRNFATNTMTITAERAFEVIGMNKKGHKPKFLLRDEEMEQHAQQKEQQDILEESVSRFDSAMKRKNKYRRPNNDKRNNHKDQKTKQ